MNYLASSVIIELQNNNDIQFLNLVPNCPKETGKIKFCPTDIAKCQSGGQNQNCVQELQIAINKNLRCINSIM